MYHNTLLGSAARLSNNIFFGHLFLTIKIKIFSNYAFFLLSNEAIILFESFFQIFRMANRAFFFSENW
jgi:hypothetical protein